MKNLNIKTAHGNLSAPLFFPDATRGFIKLCSPQDLKKAGVKALVVNTFHLYLQPGIELIKKAGGIHKFMNWDGPLLSDSGGFQIFSLIYGNKSLGKISDEGIIFKSPIDGTPHEISPEKSIQIQFDLGTDLIVCLDDCPPHDFSDEKMLQSVERTIAWAKRCHQEYIRQIKKRKLKEEERPKLLAVIQGGTSQELRKKCLEGLEEISNSEYLGLKIPFAGYGFGARPVDEEGNFLFDILDYTAKLIPDNKIKFALGIGTPADIYRCQKMGWNMFDCVIPSREGRHGKLYQFKKDLDKINKQDFYQEISIKKSYLAKQFKAINPKSNIKDLQEHSWAFLHHLFKLNEAYGQKLATLNNLEFYNKMMRRF